MKKLLYLIGLLLAVPLVSLGATFLFPSQGGLGTSTPPTYGQIPVGTAAGIYVPTATSSLGISGSGSNSVSDWLKQLNFGRLMLTASTSIDYWAKLGLYASSTLIVNGPASFVVYLVGGILTNYTIKTGFLLVFTNNFY